jgi:hypothetical protein
MNNLNKKMSWAVKLMTLAVMMNIATGCGSCKDKPKEEENKKPEVTVSFNNRTLKAADVAGKFKINNTAKEGELDTEKSDLKMAVTSTIYAVDGTTKITDADALKLITYAYGSAKGNAGEESSVSLKDCVTEKIAATKSTKDLDFKITGLDANSYSLQIPKKGA